MADNFLYVQVESFTLAGAGTAIADSTVILSSFAQINGTLLTMTNFGAKGFGTIEPGTLGREEQISFSGVTQNANGTATLTGVKTVAFVSPYTETANIAKSHPGGATFVISNTAGFYNQFASKENDETINQTWTFINTKIPTQDSYLAPTLNAQFAPKKYVDDTAIAGAPAATNGTAGILKKATTVETIAHTDNDGTYFYGIPVGITVTTSSGAGDQGKLPLLGASGELAQGFLNTNRTIGAIYSFTADNAQITSDADSSNDAVRYSLLQSQVSLNTAPGTSGEAFTVGDTLYLKAADSRLYKAKGLTTATANTFVGFASETVAGAAIATRYIKPGGVVTGLTVTAGSFYYLDNATFGAISTTKGTVPVKVGLATSSSTLLVINPVFNACASGEASVTFDGATVATVTTTWAPTKITLLAKSGQNFVSQGVAVLTTAGTTVQFSTGSKPGAAGTLQWKSDQTKAINGEDTSNNVYTCTIAFTATGFTLTPSNVASTVQAIDWIAEHTDV